MGSNTIIAIVVGAILVIVGFSLWPVLNGASNSLYSYFRDSCDDGNGNRFLRAYREDDRTQPLSPQDADAETYYPNLGFHGGRGMSITDNGNGRCETGIGGGGTDGTDGTPATLDGNGGALHSAREVRSYGILTPVEYGIDYFDYNADSNNIANGFELGPWDTNDNPVDQLASATSYIGWAEGRYPFSPYTVIPGQDGQPGLAGAGGNLFNEQGEQIASGISGTATHGEAGIPNLLTSDLAQEYIFCEGGYTIAVDVATCSIINNAIIIDTDGNDVSFYAVSDPDNFDGGTPTQGGIGGGAGSSVLDEPYIFIEVAPMLQRFSGINNLLLTILPVVSIAGFLGISGAKLYSYGKGTASIGSSISTSVFTLIGIVVAMVIAGPIMGSAVDANQVVVSGQYQVNGTFGNIIQLLFAMIPVVYIAGLVTLVGLQARTALMGYSDTGVG